MTADTKPPTLTLTDEECDSILEHTKAVRFFSRAAVRAAYAKGLAAGAVEQRKYDAETVHDMMSAPGRHVTEWDGGWTDEVAAAMCKSMVLFIESGEVKP
jgi:hypothetical protein